MGTIDIIKDKILFLLLNLLIFFIVSIPVIVSGFGLSLLIIIFILWFFPLTIYMTMDSIKLIKYYKNIRSTLNSLDRTYLLMEVVDRENFIVSKILDEILREVTRDMQENINLYKFKQEDYREYIESWVHEIKTPIASSKLIIENNRNKSTEKIESEIMKIEKYVEQTLYYARSNSVEKDYIIKKFYLKDIIVKLLKDNSKDLIANKFTIDIKNIDEFVYSDPKWIEFIINQIINNAIKYVEGNRGKLEVYCEKKNNSIDLLIRDFGIGISSRDINRVMDKGFTGENGRKYGNSTGIGLYLSKKLCDKLGLNLEVKSELGKWTLVIIKFPIDDNKLECIN